MKEIQSYSLFKATVPIGTSTRLVEFYSTTAGTIFNFIVNAMISGPIIKSWFSLLVLLALVGFLNL
jgi:hypothetical protein